MCTYRPMSGCARVYVWECIYASNLLYMHAHSTQAFVHCVYQLHCFWCASAYEYVHTCKMCYILSNRNNICAYVHVCVLCASLCVCAFGIRLLNKLCRPMFVYVYLGLYM